MRNDERQFGFTLVEMLIVVAIGVMLMAIALPAYHAMTEGAKLAQTKNVITAALGTARTYAIKKQKYAGVRFQFDRDGWREGRQYAVLIEADPDLGNAYGYVTAANMKPMILPKGMGLICVEADTDRWLDDSDAGLADGARDPCCLNGAVTFSIVFSPTGRLVRKEADVGPHNHDDRTINHSGRVALGKADEFGAILYCDTWKIDDDPGFPGDFVNKPWCYQEKSSTGLRIFEVDKMAGVERDYRHTDYAGKLDAMLLNAFTGMVIDE